MQGLEYVARRCKEKTIRVIMEWKLMGKRQSKKDVNRWIEEDLISLEMQESKENIDNQEKWMNAMMAEMILMEL